jgi:hypothetical protein
MVSFWATGKTKIRSVIRHGALDADGNREEARACVTCANDDRGSGRGKRDATVDQPEKRRVAGGQLYSVHVFELTRAEERANTLASSGQAGKTFRSPTSKTFVDANQSQIHSPAAYIRTAR